MCIYIDMYTYIHVFAVPRIPNPQNLLTHSGHRFGHQPSLYESSGQRTATLFMSLSFSSIRWFQKQVTTR